MIRSPLAQRLVPSPNVEPRRGNRAVDMLLLHYTGMASAVAALERLCCADSGVSCHYLVDYDGTITQMAGEETRAWHAGVSFWRGETDTNSRSIGIEIHNPGHWIDYRDFPEEQMAAVVALARDILTRHAIPARNVLAHSDVAPGRKIDPGEKFDWRRLAEAGIGHWVPEAPDGLGEGLDADGLRRFQHLLADYGYGIEVSGVMDEATAKATDAFQRHFRPSRVDSLPDLSCLGTLERLAISCRTDP